MSHDNIDDAMAKKYETDLSACKLRARQLETENAELRDALESCLIPLDRYATKDGWPDFGQLRKRIRAILEKTS